MSTSAPNDLLGRLGKPAPAADFTFVVKPDPAIAPGTIRGSAIICPVTFVRGFE
jgi:hypothetical protein